MKRLKAWWKSLSEADKNWRSDIFFIFSYYTFGVVATLIDNPLMFRFSVMILLLTIACRQLRKSPHKDRRRK